MNPSELPELIQRFTARLHQECPGLDASDQLQLDTEDLLDALWLAQHIPGKRWTGKTPTSNPIPTEEKKAQGTPPEPKDNEKKASVTHQSPPLSTKEEVVKPLLGTALPLQVPAASALRHQLDLSRALRPLMRKIPSSSDRIFDEEITAIRSAEQGGLWMPVMMPAPERWFDLMIVVEDGPSLHIWEQTITELQTLVERQGAFRQIKTWRLKGDNHQMLSLSQNWHRSHKDQQRCGMKRLLDPTERQIIWVVTDCTSTLWDDPQIYRWFAKWGKRSPLAIVQLLPEHFWSRTALSVAELVRVQTTWVSSGVRQMSEDGPVEVVILPVISLEPEPMRRWAKVTTGSPGISFAGAHINLKDVKPYVLPEEFRNLTPEAKLDWFFLTASLTAQKLAGYMAAVPVSIPVVHLIQQTLLPKSRQVHVAEVFMSGLLSEVEIPGQPKQYHFSELVRELLLDAVPTSKTETVIDTVSAYVSERLGLGTRSFEALITIIPELEIEKREAVAPFAEITLGTLRRLGGDYRRWADELADFLESTPPKPEKELWPKLYDYSYLIARLEVEALQRFELETATIQQEERGIFRPQKQWVITKSSGYGWQRVEDLGNGIELELVEILGGTFQMGSPESEPERYESDGPQHPVQVTDFFMSKYPVTQAQWRVVATTLPQVERKLQPDPSKFKLDRRPVEQVSWHEAVEFCARLSVHTGRAYSLPTEAEWEYACRAGTTTPFHFGEMITTELANYDGRPYNNGPKGIARNQTTDAGSFPANAFGFYDMHGNVWEWCADHWHESYQNKPLELKENGHIPWISSEKDENRLLRGGSRINHPRYCRSAYRVSAPPDARYSSLGFRIVSRAARTQP